MAKRTGNTARKSTGGTSKKKQLLGVPKPNLRSQSRPSQSPSVVPVPSAGQSRAPTPMDVDEKAKSGKVNSGDCYDRNDDVHFILFDFGPTTQ